MQTEPALESPLHRRLADELRSSDLNTVGALADALGVGVRQLERVCRRAYGRPPKRLLNEQRLVRTLLAAKSRGRRPLNTSIDASYSDYAHFCRECRRILGATPRNLFSDGEIDTAIRSLQL